MVMAKVRSSIWSEASTALLFRAPTIRGLAQEIVSAKANEVEKTDLSIPRAPFTVAQRAAGLEVWPVHAEFLQQDPADPAEAQVRPRQLGFWCTQCPARYLYCEIQGLRSQICFICSAQ
jgi:hypothetical protein